MTIRSDDLIHVIGGGACTSVGITLPSSAAAVRAGVASFGDHPFMVDSMGNPMVVARAPFLSDDVSGVDRQIKLAAPAAEEALIPLTSFTGRLRSFPVIIGVPGSRPGLRGTAAKELSRRLYERLRLRYTVSNVEAIACGNASGLLALELAVQRIRNGDTEFCLIGGVDSYLEPETLEWLEECDQLHSAGPLNNAWGFIPGEAAGFCLLASGRVTVQLDPVRRATILNVAVGQEKNLIKSGEVCLGHGLTETFKTVFQALSSTDKIENIICDMNGEPYRAEEYGFATIRTETFFVNSSDFHAPADCWGNVGAASGPLFLNLAVVGHQKGYLRGIRTLVWTSSESGERAAAVIGF
jgi:3-oxoacyl-[acyl-carrier-protein] synthase-1